MNLNANNTLPVRNEVGQPIFNFYGYRYLGVYKNQKEIDADPSHLPTAKPGDGKYEDLNQNGKLESNDRTIIGNPAPDIYIHRS